jgi:hypothetical protein
MSAPIGNQNAAKSRRVFSSALKRLFAQSPDKADALAQKLLAWAEAGEQWAFKELVDRLDGKPPQAIIGGEDDDNPVSIKEILIRAVDP